MYQYMDAKCIMVGGDKDTGRAAIYLGEQFLEGASSESACFNNKTLSSQHEFAGCEIEVWGLQY